MNNMNRSLALGLLVAASPVSFAAPDFDRIHKDVTVMSKIIQGAFENERACNGCEPRVESSYLAKQGAVFTISANSRFLFQDDFAQHDDFSFMIPGADGAQHVEIAEVVEGVLENLGTVMEDVGSRIELKLADIDTHGISHIDSETRRALRDLNRERRELEYQQREYEIELIHADDKERKEIEKRMSTLDDKVVKVEKKQAHLSEKFETERLAREHQRQAKREQAKQKAALQQEQVENIVLSSLCDYGATLKNIPNDEHVSIIFERRGEDKTTVFVMPMDDVQGCRDTKILKADATHYPF